MALIVSMAVMVIPAQADDSSKLLQKIKQLEDRIEDLEANAEVNTETVEDLESSIESLVRVSGYIDAEYIVTDKETESDGFRIHHFSVFLSKSLNPKWRIFTEIEYEDAPFYEAWADGTLQDGEGKILVEQVYTDFKVSPKLSLRAGRYLTPAGIWLINHYPPFVPTQLRPLHIRKIFPQYLDGATVSGDINFGDQLISYALYAGNGEGNAGNKDLNDEKAVGGRLALLFPTISDMAFGLSAMKDTFNDNTEKTALGADLKLRLGAFKFQAEYAQANFEPDAGDSFLSEGYYLQAQYDISRLTLFGRYDFFDPSDAVNSDKVTVASGGINWRWSPVIVSKIEVNSFDLQEGVADGDYVEWIISSAIFF